MMYSEGTVNFAVRESEAKFMSKTKAFIWAVILTSSAILFLFWHVYTCTFVLLLIACPFAVVAYRKQRRDLRIVEGATQAQLDQPQTLVIPMMTSKNTQGRLFVPPPIDRRP